MSHALEPSERRLFVAGQAGDPSYEDKQLRIRLSGGGLVIVVRPLTRLAAMRLVSAGEARWVSEAECAVLAGFRPLPGESYVTRERRTGIPWPAGGAA